MRAMHEIIICLFFLKLHTVTPQFPDHVDLQKVGEIIFNNEKYSILKPTTHIVTDYFKEFMIRRQTKLIPTKRVFLDDNGFRHFWSGYNDKIESLRKTGVEIDEKDTTDKNPNAADKDTNDLSTKNTDSVESNESPTENNNDNENNDTENNDDNANNDNSNETNDTESNDSTNTEVIERATEKATDIKDTTPHWSYYPPIKTEDNSRDDKNNNDPKDNTVKKAPVVRADDKKKLEEENKAANKAPATLTKGETATASAESVEDDKTAIRSQPGKNLAKVTFFCPFLGVVSMSAFVD